MILVIIIIQTIIMIGKHQMKVKIILFTIKFFVLITSVAVFLNLQKNINSRIYEQDIIL